jgi:hypothetical protein
MASRHSLSENLSERAILKPGWEIKVVEPVEKIGSETKRVFEARISKS